ncbi:tRNA (guanine37-N1)-methyltransferase [Pilibacter termitis]|uniref:tRNA (guanine-N(1)-)-methyltransferase n=1 Tax=Pilibacter termitis TaxID=263852 RepID=A0A1T4QTW7_9ENTE|nr:tRNA (guanosine(37)-N1)-methyltransferase TrmD [Pilibacter termitis]SKA06728.1 tRNA (guanine37-N1)-methyltransferase [Pilibacter termitis]
MRIDVLTLFPEMFQSLQYSIVGKALEAEKLSLHLHDFRDFATNKQRHVDDYPYGGNTAGMLLMPQPIFDAMEKINAETPNKKRVILLDPAGKKFDQKLAEEFAKEEQLVFLCGHYEGFDERIRTLVTDEVSLGDYILTGGELGAMVMIDATTRLLPDVLGNKTSAIADSHSTGLLEEPQYTRPADFRGLKVPDVLLSGDHEKIRKWRVKESIRRTFERRPDMLEQKVLNEEEKQFLEEIKQEEQKKQRLRNP